MAFAMAQTQSHAEPNLMDDTMEISSDAGRQHEDDDIDVDIDLPPPNRITDDFKDDPMIDNTAENQDDHMFDEDTLIEDRSLQIMEQDVVTDRDEELQDIDHTESMNDSTLVKGNPEFISNALPDDSEQPIPTENASEARLTTITNDVPLQNQSLDVTEHDQVDDSTALKHPEPDEIPNVIDNESETIVPATSGHFPSQIPVETKLDSSQADPELLESHNDQHTLSYVHPIVINWKGDQFSLFHGQDDESYHGYFLDDVSPAFSDVNDLLLALRNVLGEDCSDTEELHLVFPTLSLSVTQKPSASKAAFTLVEIIDLYYALCQNDGIEYPEPLEAILSARQDANVRLIELRQALEDGKGLSHIIPREIFEDEESDQSFHEEDVDDEQPATTVDDQIGADVKDIEENAAYADNEGIANSKQQNVPTVKEANELQQGLTDPSDNNAENDEGQQDKDEGSHDPQESHDSNLAETQTEQVFADQIEVAEEEGEEEEEEEEEEDFEEELAENEEDAHDPLNSTTPKGDYQQDHEEERENNQEVAGDLPNQQDQIEEELDRLDEYTNEEHPDSRGEVQEGEFEGYWPQDHYETFQEAEEDLYAGTSHNNVVNEQDLEDSLEREQEQLFEDDLAQGEYYIENYFDTREESNEQDRTSFVGNYTVDEGNDLLDDPSHADPEYIVNGGPGDGDLAYENYSEFLNENHETGVGVESAAVDLEHIDDFETIINTYDQDQAEGIVAAATSQPLSVDDSVVASRKRSRVQDEAGQAEATKEGNDLKKRRSS